MSDVERAAWLLGCALATLVAAQVAGMCTDDEPPVNGWDILSIICLVATALLTVAATAALP